MAGALPEKQALRGPFDLAIIPPLWPLENFVAVNPFLGFSSQRFEDACQEIKRVTGAEVLMPREYYRRRIAEGRITDRDLQEALAKAGASREAPASLSELRRAIEGTRRSLGDRAAGTVGIAQRAARRSRRRDAAPRP